MFIARARDQKKHSPGFRRKHLVYQRVEVISHFLHVVPRLALLLGHAQQVSGMKCRDQLGATVIVDASAQPGNRIGRAQECLGGELPEGDVLVVGAGNSGADIALELAADRRVFLSGELGPEIPFDIEGLSGRIIFPLLWQVWSHVLTFGSPVGRKALPKIRAGMEPRIRVKKKWLAAAGIEFVPRTAGVRDGQPLLDDGRVLDVAAVIWATGYRPALDWIDLPVIAADGDLETDHHGVVAACPGLYRVGREFLYAFNSHTVGGVGRDAKRIARRIASGREA